MIFILLFFLWVFASVGYVCALKPYCTCNTCTALLCITGDKGKIYPLQQHFQTVKRSRNKLNVDRLKHVIGLAIHPPCITSQLSNWLINLWMWVVNLRTALSCLRWVLKEIDKKTVKIRLSSSLLQITLLPLWKAFGGFGFDTEIITDHIFQHGLLYHSSRVTNWVPTALNEVKPHVQDHAGKTK